MSDEKDTEVDVTDEEEPPKAAEAEAGRGEGRDSNGEGEREAAESAGNEVVASGDGEGGAAAGDHSPPGGEDQEEDELEPDGEEGLGFEADSLASPDDEIDPDLLALGAKPMPKLYRGLVMAAVCVVVVLMMVWFRLELLYFFSPSEPIDLGEADSATLTQGVVNRYVRFDGVPLAPRSVSPSPRCGSLQGFPTYQRRFLCRGHLSAIPLMGRPEHDLVVQRYLVRQLRVSFRIPEEGRLDAMENALGAVRQIGSVHRARRTEPYELGQLIVEIQGRTGQTDLSAVMRSIRFHLESSVPGIRSIEVERVNRDAPGAFLGRAVRVSDLGSRFAAVDAYLEECTDYSLAEDTFVVLDGSEAGTDLFGGAAMCYGQAPRQYWPYLVLYVALIAVFFLNLYLLVRFVQAWRAASR